MPVWDPDAFDISLFYFGKVQVLKGFAEICLYIDWNLVNLHVEG